MTDYAMLAFDAAPVGIVLTEDRIIRACNRSFAAMLGYQVADLVGQSFRMLYGSDEEFDKIRDVGLSRLKETGVYEDERLVRHRQGHSLWCGFRAQTLHPEDPLAGVVMTFSHGSDAAPVRLTKRERQVLGLMNQRMTSKEIAATLGLSPRTIDDVRARLIRRFELRRAADLLGRMRHLG